MVFPEADGKVGWTDRLPDRLTFVSQRQSAVEVALLHHPRCIIGLAGDPAGTRAAHPNRCKKQGTGNGVSPSQLLAWAPPCPQHRDSSRAGRTQEPGSPTQLGPEKASKWFAAF